MNEDMKEVVRINAETNERTPEKTGEVGERAVEGAEDARRAVEKGVTTGYRKIEETVVGGYKKIEEGVVSGYKKIEDGVVGGFNRITDKFVGKFLTREGETVEEARRRLEQSAQKGFDKPTADSEAQAKKVNRPMMLKRSKDQTNRKEK